MPSRRQIKAMKTLFEKAFVEAFLVAKTMCIYKKLMTKNLFLTIPNFEEFNRTGPNIARLVKEVIKVVANETCGSQCSDGKSVEIATTAWEHLRDEYQAE